MPGHYFTYSIMDTDNRSTAPHLKRYKTRSQTNYIAHHVTPCSIRMVSLVPVDDSAGEAAASSSDNIPSDQKIQTLQQQINRHFATYGYEAAGGYISRIHVLSF